MEHEAALLLTEREKGVHRSCSREHGKGMIPQNLGSLRGRLNVEGEGMAKEEGPLLFHLWTTWSATVSAGTLPCLRGIMMCHGDNWALLVIHDPQWTLLSKGQDCCEGVNEVNQANICVGICLLLEGLLQTRLSVGGWASSDTKTRKAGRGLHI